MDFEYGYQSDTQINDVLLHVDEYVRHEYLSVLEQATPILVMDKHTENFEKNVNLIHLECFTYDSEDNIAQKIRSVYGTIEQRGVSAGLLLDCRENCANLYLAVFSRESSTSQFNAFIRSFNGVFPGCSYKKLNSNKTKALFEGVFQPTRGSAVAAVSAFPRYQDAASALNGLEILIDGMRGRPFTMLFLAKAMERSELVQMRQGHEALYTQIYPFQKQDMSTSVSQTGTEGVNYSKTLSQALSTSTALSVGHTHTIGTGSSRQQAPNVKDPKVFQSATQIAGAASVLLLGPGAEAAKAGANVLSSLFYSQSVSNILNSAANVLNLAPQQDTEIRTETEHEDDSVAITKNKTESQTETAAVGEGASLSFAETSGKTAQISYVNKSVTDLLSRLELQIQEMTKLENTGAFRAGAYFIAADIETASSAASIYRSITSSGSENAINSPVYCWSDPKKVEIIRKNLMHGEHPVFTFEEHPEYPNVSAAQPISLQDIPVFLCMPQKSVYGITVTEHAAFARDVLLRNKTQGTAANHLDIGCVYHMGKENQAIPVKLNTNTLTSHLFVAGATGTGKSNFCYHMIDQLVGTGIKTLIIEPAKGEYRKVFGGREDFRVYGTNLKLTPPLRINPFAFPDGITASEHIERLMSIFCAAWPMYSAMPAIMKDALEAIYRDKGFDDIWGELPEGGSFPTFSDLLDKLPQIIQESKYSQEVQGNYIGALVTRVKSLTNGIYSILFTENELSNHELFDENTIVDISRIGSEETKALIMGILITRLEEYRSCSGLMNSSLRHITLLEEAHHLLGSHGSTQSQDFGNMRGASIEMINNAIREMRTYGEGFVIADQSPSAIDGSVISNTQTKVFFMMPAREDRAIVGDVASLSEKQKNEIVKLPRGVAMVWQNEWTDALLCKIRFFSPDRYQPFSYPIDVQSVSQDLLTMAVRLLLHERKKAPNEVNKELQALTSEQIEYGCLALGSKGSLVWDIIKMYATPNNVNTFSVQELQRALNQLLDFTTQMKRCRQAEDISQWTRSMECCIRNQVDLSEDQIREAITVLLHYHTTLDSDVYRKLYIAYLSYITD